MNIGEKNIVCALQKMTSSHDSFDSAPRRRRGVGRHPSYELQRSCDRDTNVTTDTLGSLSDGDKEDIDFMLAPDLAERLVKRTETRVSQVVSSSKYVRNNCTLYQVPRFAREDFVLGDLIAFGGFSNVYAIHHFTVESELTDEPEGENKRFVIKHLNPKLAFNPKKLVVGAKDLVMEAHFLSAFDHEHIIKLRGWSAKGIAGFSAAGRADGFFLILERLSTTLSKRISCWREDEKARKLMTKGRQTAKNQLLMARLKAAMDIASAVVYLHERRILFRDLKPANVGFDPTGVLKLFDFGLAVEIPYHEDPETTFKLAGNTGTSRYMAVEVIRKDPYNLKADVFSFSILLWEIMALTKPYDGMLGPQVKESVSLFGERPSVPRSWPVAIRRLLRRGWSESVPNRPTMDVVLETLTKVYDASSKTSGKFF
jgi:serine/threonine protein kinase